MKVYKRFLSILLIVLINAVSICYLSSCGNGSKVEEDSVVMIKNAGLSTYGTGYAVGIPGKPVKNFITSYSVIATKNGAQPKTANIRSKAMEGDFIAKVVYCDSNLNIAILELDEPTDSVKPLLLKENTEIVKGEDTYYLLGYEGTGNIMSDFESFNKNNLIRVYGSVVHHDDIFTMRVYNFSKEFNRAMVGAPAFDENGVGVGMCAYSLDSMNTYSQYILSNDEIIRCLKSNGINFMTTEEYSYRNIIYMILVLGVILIVVQILLFKLKSKKLKSENKLASEEKNIKILSGPLCGNCYAFKEKIVFGRNDAMCDVIYPINQKGISGIHCTIYSENGEWYLKDELSSYGVFTEDGAQILPELPLKLPKGRTVFYIAEPENLIEVII